MSLSLGVSTLEKKLIAIFDLEFFTFSHQLKPFPNEFCLIKSFGNKNVLKFKIVAFKIVAIKFIFLNVYLLVKFLKKNSRKLWKL